jgi:subtilisin family serine protease
MNSNRSRASKSSALAIGLALIGVLLFAGSSTSDAAAPAQPASGVTPAEVTYGGPTGADAAGLALPTDQIIVKYRALMAQQEAFNPASTAAMDRLSEAAGVPLTYEREMSGDAQVLGLPTRMPLGEVQAIADSLSALPEVEYAEPDAIMVPMLTPNDPQYPNQWHYFAPGAGHYGINAPAAWDITTGSPSVVVAVIDTGITNHADLSGRTVPGYDFISNSQIANDGGGRDSDPSDPGDWITAAESGSGFFAGCQVHNSSWHGTHTAGTIGAASNNGVGVAGVNWNSKILPVRVLGKCGNYTSDIADGMRWAAGLSVSGVPANANLAKVINMSLGGAGACDATYQSAVNAITAAGTTVVVSAGNSNADAVNFQPGNCTGVITVAATNRDGGRASYSNYGATVEISAPGGDESYTNDPNGVLSTLNTGTQGPIADAYVYYQGTSMAAPHVAGIASLLYSRKPSLTPAEVLTILQNTVTNFPGGTCNTSICGSGIVNAGAAVSALGNPVPTITGLNPFFATPGGPDFMLTVNGTGFVNGAVVRWNGSDRATTRVSSTLLTTIISGSDIASPGTASATVFSPAPGGGPSNAVSFLVGIPKKVYLPLVVRSLPAPVLNAIDNADGDGNYTVSWNAVVGATSYTLEEDDNATFTSPTTQYNAAGTSWNAAGKVVATYYYRVKASNSYGSSGWSNMQSTIVGPACQNTIQNSGFESGKANWQEFSTHGWPIIMINTDLLIGVLPHGGSWAAWEGGDDSDTSYVQQTVTISCPYLAYWHWIASEDTCGNDFAGVVVNGNGVDQYDLCVDSNTGGWVKHVVNLGAYVGQTVQLQIRTETNSSMNSNLFVDDVSLQSTAAAAAAVTRQSNGMEVQSKSSLFGPRRSAVAAGSPIRLFHEASPSAR